MLTELLVGSLSDLLGRRYFFLIGLTGSLVGSIIACTAKSIPILIFASTIIGIATAMNQMILAGISEIYPRKYRGYAQGMLPLFSFLSCILSDVLNTIKGL